MPYRRYADFSGRSRRMEYWMFALFTFLVALALVIVMIAAGGMSFLSSIEDPAAPPEAPGPLFWGSLILLGVWGLASFIPSIAVTVRRFHDRDMTGWWVLIFAVLGALPYIGWIASIVQIVIMALPGTPGANRYGDDPLDPVKASVFD